MQTRMKQIKFSRSMLEAIFKCKCESTDHWHNLKTKLENLGKVSLVSCPMCYRKNVSGNLVEMNFDPSLHSQNDKHRVTQSTIPNDSFLCLLSKITATITSN